VIVGSDVGIGGGTFIAAGVVVNTGARIGRDVILNTGCAVDHDVALADHVHVGPRVALCGGVRIGEGVLLGVGSCVVPLGSVGEWSIIGAGAAVTGDLTARRVYVGVPARSVHGAEERDG
jgi:acetyltransferase EpsM